MNEQPRKRPQSERTLAGDVLTDAEYTPARITREPDGLIWGHSSVLDLDLCWDRGELRLRNPRTGQFLPTPEELQAAKEAAAERADAERAAKEAAAERADTEQVAREAAEVQVAELESKLRQLRGE